MRDINLKHKTEMRGEGDDLVDTQLEQASYRAAGKDKVQGVARGDGSLLVAKKLASRFGGDVGAGELVEVNVPVTCGNPVGDALDKGKELRQDSGVGLRVQTRAGLKVHRNDD